MLMMSGIADIRQCQISAHGVHTDTEGAWTHLQYISVHVYRCCNSQLYKCTYWPVQDCEIMIYPVHEKGLQTFSSRETFDNRDRDEHP